MAEAKYFHSDGASELVKAATDLGWCHGTSTPGRSETNGVAEAAVKKVTYGTTTILEHAGFDSKWWPRAAKHFCFASCLNKIDGVSPYNLRHGSEFDGKLVPFGALVDFKPSQTIQKSGPCFSPKGVPGSFFAII